MADNAEATVSVRRLTPDGAGAWTAPFSKAPLVLLKCFSF